MRFLLAQQESERKQTSQQVPLRRSHHGFAALKSDAALNETALAVAFLRAVEIEDGGRDLQ